MFPMIELKAGSPKFDDYVLVWESQLILFMCTQDKTFLYEGLDGVATHYEVQKLKDAFSNKKFAKSARRADSKVFFKILKSDLI